METIDLTSSSSEEQQPECTASAHHAGAQRTCAQPNRPASSLSDDRRARLHNDQHAPPAQTLQQLQQMQQQAAVQQPAPQHTAVAQQPMYTPPQAPQPYPGIAPNQLLGLPPQGAVVPWWNFMHMHMTPPAAWSPHLSGNSYPAGYYQPYPAPMIPPHGQPSLYPQHQAPAPSQQAVPSTAQQSPQVPLQGAAAALQAIVQMLHGIQPVSPNGMQHAAAQAALPQAAAGVPQAAGQAAGHARSTAQGGALPVHVKPEAGGSTAVHWRPKPDADASTPQMGDGAGPSNAGPCDGEEEEVINDDEALKGVMDGLEAADAPECDVPLGSMTVALHPYQKQAIGWMQRHENPNSSRAVQGGILADEQGLGKTVQAIALIVMEPPSLEDAADALAEAERMESNAALHPESAEARAARAAGAGVFMPDQPNGAASEESASGKRSAGAADLAGSPGASAKKAKKAPTVYQPCGRGGSCTCAICKKAKAQQRELVRKQEREELRQSTKKPSRAPGFCRAGGSGQFSTRVPVPPGQDKLTKPSIFSTDNSIAKRTLVICPLCVAQQWIDEINEKAPQLRTALYHGPNRLRDFSPMLLVSYDVVLTTYHVLSSEFNAAPQGALYRVRWHRCILDEAHMIRNMRTQAAKAAHEIDATRRWCLTGTPIVNTATDVFSLFVFLSYRPFNDATIFNTQIRNLVQTVKYRGGRRSIPIAEKRAAGFRQLRIAMKAVTLRRVKTEQYNGRPMVTLPPSTVSVDHLVFSPEEEAIYSAYEAQTQVDFRKYAREGFGANYANILVLLMRLRQVCIHPHLAMTAGGASLPGAAEGSEDGSDQLAGLSGERKAQLLEKLVGKDVGECPVCMDGAQDPVISLCAHGPFCRDCITTSLQHQGGDAAEGTCPLCRANVDLTKLFSPAQLQPPAPVAEPEDKDVEDPEESEFVSSTKLDACADQLLKSLQEDEASGQSTKTIIFCTFTKALDLMEARLAQTGACWQRLDGKMRLEQRSAVTREFAQDPEVRVLLASTKAAGTGLNLTCACRVIILDVWWTWAHEDQAIARSHRLGQMREVNVSKLIMKMRTPGKETIEERIMQMQEDKRQIAEAALTDGMAGQQQRLTFQELRRLFGLAR